MKNRHIAMISPPWYPTPPIGYGGIELMVGLLVNALRAQGHEVTLYGAEGSMANTLEFAPAGWSSDLGGADHTVRENTYICKVLADLKKQDVDLIHDHSGWSALMLLSHNNLNPLVHTVHGPLTESRKTLYATLPSRMGLVAISQSQQSLAPTLAWTGFIHNAVDFDNLKTCPADDKDDYLVCLARICPDKGQHIAIEVAKRTGRRLIIAGKIGEIESWQRYFNEQILPHIDGEQIIHLPNVSGREKTHLLSHATALLAPLQWSEPFGLAPVEAMVSGTPAIIFNRGSAAELIEEGRTGFLVEDAEGMIAALDRLPEIDAETCAALTRKRFGANTMAQNYAEIYEKVIDSYRPTLSVTGRSSLQTRITAPKLAATLKPVSIQGGMTAPALVSDSDP